MSQIISGPNITKLISHQEKNGWISGKNIAVSADCYPFLVCCDPRGSLSAKVNPWAQDSAVCSGPDRHWALWTNLTHFLQTPELHGFGTKFIFHFSSPSTPKVKKSAEAAQTPSKVWFLKRVDIFALFHIGIELTKLLWVILEETRWERKRKWRGGGCGGHKDGRRHQEGEEEKEERKEIEASRRGSGWGSSRGRNWGELYFSKPVKSDQVILHFYNGYN